MPEVKQSDALAEENASSEMLCGESEETSIQLTAEKRTGSPEITSSSLTPEKGRVWRRRNNTVTSRKTTEGPVLRATVKPVKRFIPELSSVASGSSSTTQQGVQSNLKPIVPSTLDDTLLVEPKPKRQNTNPPQSSQPCTKKKRVREQWSIEDKNHFFDAVAVHGKDFEAIQKAIAQKHKKRGDETVVKTKDQVRHLYYRTWTTINKLLDHDASQGHNAKGTQELYAVINYGELRKKLGGSDLLKKKGMLKLNELINLGSTSIRVKGKNYRIKTPSCKALKKIHDKEDAIKKASVTETRRIKLPLRVNVEFHPRTMNAWNRVHLLAHNPRIKFNVPLDCQLSYLFVYLTKKWRPLSSKLFEVAEHGHLLDDPVNYDTTLTSQLDDLEIHIPPEAAIKARVQVHQVITTKTHCVVSYVMHKTGKQMTSTKRRKKYAHNTSLTDGSQAPAVDSCVSSEDECAVADPLSDSEVQCVGTNDEMGQSIPLDYAVEDADDNHIEDSNGIHKNISHFEEADADNTCFTFQQEAEICAENDDDSCPTAESADSCESTESNHFNNAATASSHNNSDLTESPETDAKEQSEKLTANVESSNTKSLLFLPASENETDINMVEKLGDSLENDCIVENDKHTFMDNNDDNAMLVDSEILQEVGSSKNKNVTFSTPLVNTDCASKVSEPTSPFLNNKPLPADVSDSGIDTLQYHSVEEHTHTPLYSKPIQRSWNCENVGDKTLAEVYLMLGKPSTFKLCYDWIKQQSKTEETSVMEKTIANHQISSGMAALLQAATLLHVKINKGNVENPASLSKDSNKNISKKEKTNVNIGIQCNIAEKSPATTNGPSILTSAKKTHGRGSSKFNTPLSSVDSSNLFAVPNHPASLRRKAQSVETGSLGMQLLDPEEIRQRVQVRLGDVQFRKQMEALNRRKDLFRPQNRNRSARKPFIVQRTMMPNAGAVRKMMTLSIDSSGANKVGFTASLPTSSSSTVIQTQSQIEAVGMTRPKLSSAGFGEALGLKIQNQSETEATAATSYDTQNVLAMAAKEAGLSLSSPVKDSSESLTVNGQTPVEERNNNVIREGVNSPVQSEETEVEHGSLPTSSDSVLTTLQSVITEGSSNLETNSTESSFIGSDVTLPVRPLTPNVDAILDSFGIGNDSNDFHSARQLLKDNFFSEVKSTPSLSMPVLDLPMTPQKSGASSPVHPWTINCNSRDGLCGFATLNTPQRILPSDTEDSMDSVISGLSKRPRLVQTGGDNLGNGSFYNDPEMDLQLQCLMSENSVDFMVKFQDLMHQTIQENKPDSPGTTETRETLSKKMDH